ncbi:MAG TPA: hypothetical protein VET23_05300 [Chitinophagaceae bacterium]|nr:hypothetical protein [Chitinophagaceae bacterium]
MKYLNFKKANFQVMVKFFQVLFLVAAIVLLVLNVIHFNKYRESKKQPDAKLHSIKWFDFILTSLVALGCALNIIIEWISK